MAESKELKKIKKLYGENFMKLCRELFPTLLEHEGLLTQVLTNSFATNSRTLYEDLIRNDLVEDFKNYIFSKVDVEKEKPEIIENKTPYELLEEAGYDLYECTSEEEIQSFKKYYKPGEGLCTFIGRRLDRCVVFWAVKKGAEEIEREDFREPKREDEYGTSVMSIQFSKTQSSTVSIKNRYNHTVNNPDATYGNDLDRIIPGLEQSFADLLAERGYKLENTNIEEFEIPGYTVGPDGKYYRYKMEINGIYYCPGNVIIDHGRIIKLEPEKQVLIDYFILDKENKTLKTYDKELDGDSFIDGFEGIKTIHVEKDDEKEKGARRITIQLENSDNPIIVEIDRDNNIIGYKNEELQCIKDNFLFDNGGLRELELPNLIEVGNNFLVYNKGLIQLELPNLTEVGDEFLCYNKGLIQLELPNLTEVGENFIRNNKELIQLELPSLTEVGNNFLFYNSGLSQLKSPNLTEVGNNFLFCNKGLIQLELPNLTEVGNDFLYFNEGLRKLELPNLAEAGDGFLFNNKGLIQLELPKLEHKNKYVFDRLLNIAEENKRKENIDKEKIAQLDRERNLTTTEINQGRDALERIATVEKEQNEKLS